MWDISGYNGLEYMGALFSILSWRNCEKQPICVYEADEIQSLYTESCDIPPERRAEIYSINMAESLPLHPSKTTVSMLVLVVVASVTTVYWNGTSMLQAMRGDCVLGMSEKAAASMFTK